MIHQLRFV